MSTLPPSQRADRAAWLCCHFTRNFAYYTAAMQHLPQDRQGLWLTVTGDLLDICVLEWCKLFGNRNGKYHWKQVTLDPTSFLSALLNTHHLSQKELDAIYGEIKRYRDDFVAHTEESEITQVPAMSTPYLLVSFLYERTLHDFPHLRARDSLPTDLSAYYDEHLQEAKGAFAKIAHIATGSGAP